MGVLDDHNVTETLVEILSALPGRDGGTHHFGRPWMTAYQLSIELERANPAGFEAFSGKAGGAGSGDPTSVPQQLARALSYKIKHDDDYPIEGADLSTKRVHGLSFDRYGGDVITSSVEGGDPLSMFRYRH